MASTVSRGHHRTPQRPPLQTLSLWTPRTARADGIVTVIAQVNTPGAAVWLATRYGAGLEQVRQEVASARGLVVTRLQAVVPARCTGPVAARVYVTATAGERAMTRAATFMVQCPRAHVRDLSHDQAQETAGDAHVSP